MAAEPMKTDLRAQLRQELRLTPQLLQSMEVLQMNAQEVLEYINRAVEENPVLEREEPSALQREYRQLCRHVSWLDASAVAASHQWDRPQGKAANELDSLDAFLRDQLSRLRLPREMEALCRYMVQMVDEDGYLPQEELDSLQELRLPCEMVEQALVILQSLEPAGVAARDLGECLELQLRRKGENGIAIAIVRQYLPQLGRQQYGAIAREMHITEGEVREAQKKIAALEPYPGRAFQTGTETELIRPDIFVAELDGQWQVILNEYYLPRITVSAYYAELAGKTADAETAAYLRKKLRSAREVLQNLERRSSTLRRCGETVLARQGGFFAGKTKELMPMTMRELAQELEVHPSTVTRALRGKYLQCRQGTYPLRYFFSPCGGGVSRQAVQQKLLELIGQEDSAHPFSDEKLRLLLAEQGVEIARRTVAKYREELRIPTAAARRKR